MSLMALRIALPAARVASPPPPCFLRPCASSACGGRREQGCQGQAAGVDEFPGACTVCRAARQFISCSPATFAVDAAQFGTRALLP